MIKRSILIITFISVLISLWLYFLYGPSIETETKYIVRPGASMGLVIDDLHAKNIIKHPLLFRLFVRLKNNSQELKAGEYLFVKGASTSKILHQITTGTGLAFHTFTIIPGWNFKQLRQALSNHSDLKHEILALDDAVLMKQINAADVKGPEGLFYPDTYYFNEGSTDIALLKRAYLAMQQKLKILWAQRATDLPYKTAYEALIVASLIEKEAEQDAERPIIAGVILNRLKKEMLLQIDPTVIYGMKENFTGVIHRTDLRENTPYNTYVRKGLPPTPIAIPGLESLQAAMHPQKHGFYYFVLRNDGTHQFSKTLEEHNKAVLESRKTQSGFFNKELVRYYVSRSLGIF